LNRQVKRFPELARTACGHRSLKAVEKILEPGLSGTQTGFLEACSNPSIHSLQSLIRYESNKSFNDDSKFKHAPFNATGSMCTRSGRAGTAVSSSSEPPQVNEGSRKRKLYNFLDDQKNIDYSRAAKKGKFDERNSEPVLQTGLKPEEQQKILPAEQQISASELIEKQDANAMKSFLQRGHVTPQCKSSMLCKAASSGWLEGFDLLIEFGAHDDYKKEHVNRIANGEPLIIDCVLQGRNLALLKRLIGVLPHLHVLTHKELLQVMQASILILHPISLVPLWNAIDCLGVKWGPQDMKRFFVLLRENRKENALLRMAS
jgi:hypothetical protein